MEQFIQVFEQRKGQLFQAFLEHLQISFIALLIAILIGIPVGIYITKHRKIAEAVMGIAAIFQTIPSLALLGLLIPLVGIGTIPAIIALVVYALLPILRNTYTGIKEVDASLIEAAHAMGMNNRKRLIKVELPLAFPVIMAGIRTATVLIVGTATLAALIGAGGLGDIILLGIDRNDHYLIILGAIPAALLAIIFDVVLRMIEHYPFKRTLQIGSIAIVAVLLIIIIPQLGGNKGEKLVIAGKLGAEPEILINMYKLLIEKDTDLTVELKPGLGKTSMVFNALKSGNIDIYPEFTGTAISTFLKEEAVSTDAAAVYKQAEKGMLAKYKMIMLKPMKYSNTYALAVPNDYAKNNNLQTITDLKKVQDRVKVGFTLEFSDREDGYKGIIKKYGIEFPHMQTMEPKLRYNALKQGDIQLLDAYSTDSELKQYNMKILQDDQHLFPPYQGAPLLRKETLKKYPELKEILNKLAGKITEDEMQEMNYLVNVDGQSAKIVAKQYLQKHGILNK
ncbi:hypothetical protein B4102_3046 [Heyndrickxia sporothermodurans]|uniref:Probable ergothioneine transporter EgtUBC n=1 Tax=Heyndrickxia sporothermodurans TaxID=46224 RepID=A0A150L2V1_9BACI|nr:ABC transporter permease/substrate-binding protein [Heyndrickxia sporothermodurans]KYD06661.1 hypothetical protein B4102_3046 [Heyndrickxia sporothermodurans]